MDINSHVENIAERTGLSQVLSRKIGNLSKGYRQRVGFAQALCGSPEVIILDEPTVGLDPRQSSEMRSLVKSLAGDHTVLFSSHILQSLCDRVLILHHGKMIYDSALHPAGSQRKIRAVIACGEGTLLPALQSLKSAGKIEVERGGEPGLTQVIITAEENAPVERELFTLLSGLRYPLLRLIPLEDSLEDILLRATGTP